MSLGTKHAREHTLPTPPTSLPTIGPVPDSIVFTARHGNLGLHCSSANFVFLCHNLVGNCPRRSFLLSAARKNTDLTGTGVMIERGGLGESCARKNGEREL
jgi:hypothetical protein